MNKKELKNIVEDVIAEVMAEVIFNMVKERLKVATVVFTGGSIGLEDGIKALNILENQGWMLNVVLTSQAEKVITREKLENTLITKNIFLEEQVEDIHQLCKKGTVIIVPTLTINTAAKVANCISDNVATRAVAYGILNKKPVIAAINGCCPTNQERYEIHGEIREAYKNKMNENMEIIKSYGVIACKAKNINYKVDKVFSSLLDGVEKVNSTKDTTENASESVTVTSKKIVSMADIQMHSKGETLYIREDAIVTYLAQESADAMGIKLKRENLKRV